INDVDGRIPGLFDRIDEFRETLARAFQVELNSVLSSFDSTVSGILEEMKSELQLGIGRIESIENMVHSRQGAGRTLLGVAEEPELPEGPGEEGELELPEDPGEEEGPELPEGPSEEEEQFEEWEQEAKELAEREEDEETPAPPPQTEAAEDADSEYPAEMGQIGSDIEEDLAEAMSAEDVEDQDEAKPE
ncbi:MAG: hypothetical protein ACYS1C_12155, partial [Planctomycetota bacterium]